MIDITYCASKTCPEQGRCGRHISNNDLKGKIYSISDFTPMNKGCEFFIECIKKEAPYLCEYCGEELHGGNAGEPRSDYEDQCEKRA